MTSPPRPLADRRCVPCEKGTPPLEDAVVAELLTQLEGWRLDAEGRLSKTFHFKGFMPGVKLIEQIANVAESEGHHPDLCLGWGSLTVNLITHSIGGLSENDFVLAAKIDRVVGEA